VSFARLHPVVQHHVVNTLGWRSLRPLQEAAIEPLLAGEDAILLAPTAGGKTEAACFPLLTRMASEEWSGLSLLYLCPIKALLNNVHRRVETFCGWLGRRAELWHGDVSESARGRIRRDPPDVILTTPESIEAQLVSSKTDAKVLFGGVRAVVIDEVHAFAGDDRGWHLLGVLSRLEHLVGRPIQRVGLSATVGNPDELLGWLSLPGRSRRVLNPTATPTTEAIDVQLDYVGTLANAAQVISQLHRGRKRLVFCDSRARVEELALLLRERRVNTFVSHSSLGLQERRDAERAFAEAEDCVIVATSTLELGIDVGDLDHVIQIDAPRTVASFLQRLGRTGRRTGTVRNCLFLAIREDALVRAAALIALWRSGYVEPIEPPPSPSHVLAQQLMGLALQERGITRTSWRDPLRSFLAASGLGEDEALAILEHMLREGLFHEDEGLIWFGARGEREFGYRHFMDLMAVFASEPMLQVRHGRTELGVIHPLAVLSAKEDQQFSLGGRPWKILEVDWSKHIVTVVPGSGHAKTRWSGDPVPLPHALCQATRTLLASDTIDPAWSTRARQAIEEQRRQMSFVEPFSTVLHTIDGTTLWWTFAGLLANAQLAAWIATQFGIRPVADNLRLVLDSSTDPAKLRVALDQIRGAPPFDLDTALTAAENLKFRQCLPMETLWTVLQARYGGGVGLSQALDERVRVRTEPLEGGPA
jgi:ATP-dependent helicase Lhr and Lhr-like helicase